MKKICKFLIIISLYLVYSGTSAEQFPQATKDTKNLVIQAVEKWLQGRYKVDEVSKTPVKGLLEVRIGNELFYVDNSAKYVILEGRMINLDSGEDLTAIRLDKILTIDFESLPLDLAIKTQTESFSKEKKIIAVFEDPNCSYCKKYRMTLEKIKGLTIYTFLLPILSENSVDISKRIWCSKDKSIAWQDFMIRGIKPAEAPVECDFPKDRLMALGKKLGINATPTSYLVSGKRLPGAVNKDLLEREFSLLYQ